MAKVRLDALLIERGICDSRSKAAAWIMAGKVSVAGQRRADAKPGQFVSPDVSLQVREGPEFVSRGGRKLANCLDALKIDVAGRVALDVGASTGGFTDCLLKRGTERVVCLDVAYGALDLRLHEDARVTVLDRTNARYLEQSALPYRPDLIVIDVSFISLLTVLPAILAVAADRFDCFALIKPQFEVGRKAVGKGGVVRDPELRRSALLKVAEGAQSLKAAVAGFASSGLPGPKGNRETFIHLAESERSFPPLNLNQAVMEIEP